MASVPFKEILKVLILGSKEVAFVGKLTQFEVGVIEEGAHDEDVDQVSDHLLCFHF